MTTYRRFLAASMAALALTACGTDMDKRTARDDAAGSGGQAGRSVGGPAEAIAPADALDVAIGETVRVRGSVVVEGRKAVICDALTETYPPRCVGGVPLAAFDPESLPPEAEAVDGVRWVEGIEIIALRTEDGLRYQEGESS